MPKEIERRFLVYDIDPRTRDFRHDFIEQGYLDTSPAYTTRIRIMNRAKAYAGAKDGVGVEREEREPEMSVELARFFMERCAYRLVKNRHYRDGWEVDFYDDALAGLVIAEFPMSSIDAPVTLPSWIGRAREITDSITNFHLARLAADLELGSRSIRLDDLVGRRVPRIVLTGGPCSGKSTIIELLRAERGNMLHCVPEVASMVIAQVGVTPPRDHLGNRLFNRTMCQVQKGFELVAELEARRTGKLATILDRGMIDNAVYIHDGVRGLEDILRTRRDYEYADYDAVICLAIPPREVFEEKKRNNPARKETYEEATALSAKIEEVWHDHPRFHLINTDSWDTKVTLVGQLVDKVLEHARAAP